VLLLVSREYFKSEKKRSIQKEKNPASSSSGGRCLIYIYIYICCICGNFTKQTNLIKQIQTLHRARVCYDGPSLFCLVSEPLAAETLAGEEEGEGTGGGEAE
jgi:hypothetical protein